MLGFYLVKILFLATLSFVAAFIVTPFLSHFLYKYKMGKHIRSDGSTPVMSALHAKKAGTPTMGGILMWGTTLCLALLFFYLHSWFPDSWIGRLNFLSRSETLLPLGALVLAGLVGMADDWFNINRMISKSGGFTMKQRLGLYTVVASICAWWFYSKLGWDIFHVPFLGDFSIGWWYIPIFIFIIVATAFSVNEIDGLDGLAGGTLLAAFMSMAVMAFLLGRYDLAAFCGVIMGSLLAFLWYNIPPARFYMGDTGAMSLGVVLGIMAMLTNTALFLPIIGILFVVESLSVIIQLLSKRFRGKKVFLSAPIHHHLEAIGWPESKIVMRFWVISAVSAAFGLALFILDRIL
ncbi:MAG: Phospho-N-acetylmuramoyl-pentapeptide-transferase [Parcubacteria group bacterium Gr01-1014_18]|nr:MAG: Phospho-N-acetylmuramoyl-pentapeptide-transferase [Parcubacteria group bacterium Greene0416_36]TSC81543.1 MAG: Phospho-N-acetylmuramoyl-pentapeptide-transferase [Parcubacteria group bacterium Gr01-1014_18]TSC99646.1 MAG: Phospho-N-acetylmuramoyl-pentapeptide-transferase [Parcubacteria group bacterium Greene1014_20]TSD07097.1 MAG: Phospho-N-acetylmuramoyl-pentapeptide-transferase [Parcubacteria group bacterium Greene0714_2]